MAIREFVIGSQIARLAHRTLGTAKRLKLRAKTTFWHFHPITILPFRGYGTPSEVVVSGRILEARGVAQVNGERPRQEGSSAWSNLKATFHRFESDDIPGARLVARLGRARVDLQADEDGYFQTRIGQIDPPLEPGWHDVQLELVESIAGGSGLQATAEVLVPPHDADFAVVSDIDDTILPSAVTNRLRMIRIVLFQSARTRSPFPGVGAFYRALKLGPSGAGTNPLFYLSKSPSNLYDLFRAFFELNDIPRGPLFLRDLRLREGLFPAFAARQDKLARLRVLLAIYPELPFVLVGDSAQRDPEVYRQIALEHPGRVRAIYIRDVTALRRESQVKAIAEEMHAHGVPLILARETFEAARHAADLGLIAPSALDEIREVSVRGG